MKKIIFFLLLFPAISFGQELTKNPDTGINEFVKVTEFSESPEDKINAFLKKLLGLKYSNVSSQDNLIVADGSFSHLVMGNFPVEVSYNLNIEFKENRYRLILNRFTTSDHNKVPIPLEDLRSHQNRWIKNINAKLPAIVKALESGSNSNW